MIEAARGAAGPARPVRRGRARSDALQHALFGLVPALITLFIAYHAINKGIAGVDFRYAYWPAGWRLGHGGGVYNWTHLQVAGGEAFVYPALAAIVFLPFSYLSAVAGGIVFMVINLLAVLLTLRVLEVRDWRVYGVCLAIPWVFAGWQTGNLTLLLGLGLAVIWRYRDQPIVAGAIAAILVSLKPFIVPVVLWLIATRRWRATGTCLVAGLAINLVAWGVVGFSQVGAYLHLTSQVTSALEHTGYGVISLAAHLGISTGVGTAVEVAAALGAAIACLVTGWRGFDRLSLTWMIVTTLLAGPLVWSHYLALLVIPLTLAHPRLNRAWLLPLLLWECDVRTTMGWQVVLTWVLVALLTFDLLRSPRPETVPT